MPQFESLMSKLLCFQMIAFTISQPSETSFGHCDVFHDFQFRCDIDRPSRIIPSCLNVLRSAMRDREINQTAYLNDGIADFLRSCERRLQVLVSLLEIAAPQVDKTEHKLNV